MNFPKKDGFIENLSPKMMAILQPERKERMKVIFVNNKMQIRRLSAYVFY